MRLACAALLLSTSSLFAAAPGPDPDGWIPLFDGRSLDGWRGSENPGSVKVVDGTLLCDGPRSHLFYVGPVQDARFRNFEFEAEVRTRPGANSGIFFHTAYQETDWPAQGYEVQVNNTATGEGGYRENKKTGSLYSVRNVYRQIVPDDEWFTIRIAVRGRHIVVRVNDLVTVDYVQPSNPPGKPGRRLSAGTFALQCHDPGSRVQYRAIRVRPLPDDLPEVPEGRGEDVTPAGLAGLFENNFPVADLHTHLKGGLTLEEVVTRQLRTGINAGVAVNCGLGFPITNDAGIYAALPEIRDPRVFTAMQAEGREWTRMFSREAMAQFDYVFTDSMTFANDAGQRMRLWIKEEVVIGEPQAFMELLVKRAVAILETEPIDIYVNPTFLPDDLARDYDRLWTPERMQRVIDAAVKQGIAIEINDRFRLPSAAFIRLAKKAGAKFTFGTNNGGRNDLGRLDHCVQMVRDCGLAWDDLWVPGQAPSRARRSLHLGK